MTRGLSRIDGPPPVAPLYGLLPSAASVAPGVRIVPDADGRGIERWMNGVVVYPYGTGLSNIHNGWARGSARLKVAAPEQPEWPEFEPMTVYWTGECTAYRTWNQQEYRARLIAEFSAVESASVAREFVRGETLDSQPFLADGNGEFPNGDTATSPRHALALLEEEIALTGKAGVIHISPTVLMALGGIGIGTVVSDGGVIRTINGTLIVPDAGYAGGSQPLGHASGEWVYATGPIEIRRSEVFVTPDDVSQALDRVDNNLEYRVERYYLVDWDGLLHAAVNVDICNGECVTVNS